MTPREDNSRADQPERRVLHSVKLLQGRFGGTHPGQKAVLHGRPNESLIKAQLTSHVQERRHFLEEVHPLVRLGCDAAEMRSEGELAIKYHTEEPNFVLLCHRDVVEADGG